MTRIKPIDLAHLGTPQSGPVQPSAAPAAAPRRDWLLWLAWAALLGFIVWQNWRPIPGPSPRPDIDVDGLYVMVVVDGDKRDISEGQGAVINSAKIPETVRGKGGQYRRADRKDDIAIYGEPWIAMQRAATSPPQMVTLKGGRIQVRTIPASVDEATRIIEGL
jgi:hypothetical protein